MSHSPEVFDEFSQVDPSDLAAQSAEMQKLRRRLNLVMEYSREGRSLLPPVISRSVAQLRKPIVEQELREEAEVEMTDFDLRDVPELIEYAEKLGYHHGYEGRPLRFSEFGRIMRSEKGVQYHGLDPKHYESYYVGGHMRGENDVVQYAQYAISHGESRAPGAPVMGEHHNPI